MDLQKLITKIPTQAVINSLSDSKFNQLLDTIEKDLKNLSSDSDKLQVLDYAKLNPTWQIRLLFLHKAWEWASSFSAAREYIFAATHDSTDSIAFQAIRYSGELNDKNAIPHLTRISGWPSSFTKEGYLRKPVGVGASLTKNALVNLFGTRDLQELKEAENQFLQPYRELLSKHKRPVLDQEKMAYVPAGKFLMGTKNVDDFRFYYKDFIPMHEVELAGYHIDKHPVTNEQYKNFLQFINQNGHVCCHPDEDPNRDHTAAHIRDPRFNQDDMPVTGIDWYDAYAYAAYAGKKLPTDEQWEKAARGTEGQQYPWGNDWQPEHAHYAESCFNAEINNLDEWEDVLRNYSGVYPRKTVVANNAIAGNVSPYGVYDMVGNVWEWTRTNYFTRKHMDPFFKGRDQADFMNRASAFAVIRGGCFTSLPEMLRTYYRGKDLLTDRHCEIGFRCVSEDE